METFYDGDLKDIWDSDLDPTESLKISTDHDMHDWFLERDVKDPAVILNDKLISDALLNGTLPIKSEHSYSLNSDGDSLPDSPRSLQAKMDDMDDECYPAISLKTATSNLRSHLTATIDPKCLTLHPPISMSCSPVAVASLGFTRASNALLSSSNTISSSSIPTAATATTTTPTALGQQASSGFGRVANGSVTLNLRNSTLLEHQLQQRQQQQQQQLKTSTLDLHTAAHQQYLPQKFAASLYDDNDCGSSVSTRDGSISPDICSDIEIDESCIKDEPLSPNSSCPASPNSQNSDLSVASVAHMANELVFEHKHGSLQLTSTSHGFLKSQQQLLLGNQNSLIVPKVSVKNEKLQQQQQQQQSANMLYTNATPPKSNSNAYGIPLTPPSSLPSDESEGNLTPEHLFSPLSPNASVSISVAALAANGTLTTTTAASMDQNTRRGNSSTAVAAAAMGANCGRNVNNSTTTRQPIHTPLISSQPKGSTGMLLLTEEEKRTLLAEGYPIPQKLPLTKAEEKSLKKIRRKIKNKISAQESRRKKKEYMDQLERRVEILVNENNDFKQRVDSLEDTNSNLLSQLQKLQAMVNKHSNKKA